MNNEVIAIIRFLFGENPSISTFIDGNTLTYGYGELDDFGCWQFELPFSFCKKHGLIVEV